MAKFLENTSDINRSIKKKKKKQETVTKPQSPSAPKQQRVQQAQNQKTYGGMPQPQQQTVKRPSTSSSKSTSKNVSRNVSQQTQRTVDRLQQKYGTNNQSRTQSRTASRPQTQTKRYQPHTAERLSERREQIRADRNRANSNQATLDRLQDRYGRNKGHNRWNEELKPEQAETAKDRLQEKFASGKVKGGEETKLDEAGRVTKRIGKAFGQGAELAVTEDRKLLNKFSNPSTANKFYNRELNPEDMEKNKKKLALRDEGLRQKILKQQEDMSKLEAQGGSYLERMAIQGAQSAGGMAVDALAGPMSLVHMGARVTEGSYVAEEEKVRKLRQRVEESGQYTPEEIDEMFKDMDKRIMASALSEAAIEVLTEKMFGGIGMASKVVGGKGFLDAAASKLTGRLGASVAGRMLRGTAEEIAEEEIGNPAQAFMSNLIMNNRLNEINQDVTRRGIEAQSTDLISRIGSEEDARAVAANLNSESFLDEAAAGFRESGASKKEAQELAEMTRDYLYASVTGDTEKAEEIREKMVDKLAGEEQYKEKWTLQDAIDVAVSTGIMTAATGAPGAITSAAVGANYKSEKGVQGVKKLAELTKSLDPEKSARAQAVIDRIDSGKDVSNSQVYEIMSWSQEATAEATKREQAKDSIVRRKMEEENLLVPASTRASDGSYMLSPKTEDRFEQIADETMEKFDQMTIEDSETELSEEDKYTIADAVAAFQTGTITAEQINELNYDRPAARKVFQEVTGIDLDQYNEKTKAGNINEAASNVRMQEALFARAAENYVESARAEQAHWDNVTRGEYVEQLESNNRMGSEGSKALTTAIKSVDPRDQRKLMRMGAAANSLYERALYSNDSWEDVRAEAAKNFSSLDISALKAVFDSGKADRAIQETAFYGRAVKANEKLTKKSLAEAEQVAVPGEVVNKTGRTVTADDLLFLQSVADTLNIKVEAVDIEPRYEGWFKESTGVLTVNLNEGVKKPLRMVVTHELTHSNIYAPDEFMKLLRYIGDAWYKADPAGYKAAIDERKARYKEEQELNDLDALEEIVADGSIDYNFWNDEDLAATLATEDPGLAQKFLNAIRELLRKIRSILADQPAELEDDRVYTSLYADAIDMAEAERLMLNALKAARQVRNENAIEAWDAEARGETAEDNENELEAERFSIVEDPQLIKQLESDDHITTYRGMVKIDGKYYSPMSSKVRNEEGRYELREGMEPGQWVEAELTTDSKMFYPNGDYKLMKDNGKSIKAAYNPYMHSSDSMMNDQFATQYKRPNLVVIEGVIPASEINNGIRVEHDLDDGRHVVAKDPTGIAKWKPGPIEAKLPKDRQRTVYLSNHFKMIREVPAAEVAQHIYDKLDGTDVSITYNVVTPDVREELQKLGAKMEQSKEAKYFVEDAEAPVRYSINDTDYMDAVESGDMDAAQRMVDEVAAKAGYNIKVYHGTANGGRFNIFDPKKLNNSKLSSYIGQGFYFTNSREGAEEYTVDSDIYGNRSKGKDPYLYEGYLKLQNPIEINENSHNLSLQQIRDIVADGNKEWFFDRGIAQQLQNKEVGGAKYTKDEILRMGREQKINLYAQYLSESGDREALSNLVDAYAFDKQEDLLIAMQAHTGHDGIHWHMKEGLDQFVVFDSSQFKESAPVTYDDSGNVIPLSERFNQENPDIRYSVSTDKEDFVKGKEIPKSLRDWAKEIGLDTISKHPVKAPVIVSVRDLRTAWYEKEGRSEEAKVINEALDKIGNSLTELVGKYQYIDLGDAINARIEYRTDADGKPTSVILSCQVKNAEYEVNFDFTTICAKRLAMQKVLEKFIKTEGEHKDTLYDELKLDEEGMYKLRLILEQAGFEVSCRGCFVEQNRYSQQNQARTIANDWNAALDAWAAENGVEVTDNFDLVNMDINSLDYEEIERGFERYHELMKGKSANVETKNRMLIESSPFFRKRMNSSDYASLAGQRALMAIGESKKGGTSLYGLLKRGQSDSKQSVPFTAYNGEVALLPDKMKGKDLYDYLLSIGGARAQSASDFQIEFLYDYMQLVADLSARGLPMHMYTKVIELAELFGMTGIKINLSAMCDVDPALTGEYAGLKMVDGKYEYNISDQSIDYPKAVELQKKDGYSKNIGIIMVVLSKEHMLKSLDDSDVRYIIGYHSSAMPVVVANMSKMGDATDYTKLNKTNKLNPKGQALFDAAMQEAKGDTELAKFKDALRIFDEKIQEDVSTKKSKPRRGNEYGSYMTPFKGNTADFNTYENIQETKDARKTADKYIEYCMNNGLIPMYFPFAFHENYYKCEVYDFNMYDNVTGEYAPMSAVQNIYPGLNMAAGETDTTEFMDRVSEMMNERNEFNKVQSAMYEPVIEKAKETLRFSISGDDYMDFDASGIDHADLEHRVDAIRTEAEVRDDAYMDAVNSNDMEEAQSLVDEAAKRAGFRPVHRYHGSMNADFTVFDKAYAKVGGNSGAGFYFSTSEEDSADHYADVEGADNYFKWSSLADQIMDEGEWNGEIVEDRDRAVEIAKEELNKAPGMFDVYLNYGTPYVRDYRNSTNIYDKIMDDFDESLVDRDDYDNEDDYEEGLYEYRSEHVYDTIDNAVRGALDDLENFYDIIDYPDIQELVLNLTNHAEEWGSLTWSDILETIEQSTYMELIRDDWTESGYGAAEFTRAIIENFGYDAIEDKEVSTKFGQLSREMQTDTEHIIVFKPEQIKLSDPITYAEDGSVIPLSERFDPNNDDIRYSMSTVDSDGNVLSDGQMEYFKNSQARDAEGKLQVVYHTTTRGGFTIFDPAYSDDKRSLFFSSSLDVSQTYGYGYESRKRFNFDRFTDAESLVAYINDGHYDDFQVLTEKELETVQRTNWRGIRSDIGKTEFERKRLKGKKAQTHTILDVYLEDLQKNKLKDDYILAMKVPDQMGDWNAAFVTGETIEDIIEKLNAEKERKMSKSTDTGYYAVYLNLENPMIVDAKGGRWNKIPYGLGAEEARKIAADSIYDLVVEWDYDDEGRPASVSMSIFGETKDADGEWIEYETGDYFSASDYDENDPEEVKQHLLDDMMNAWTDTYGYDYELFNMLMYEYGDIDDNISSIGETVWVDDTGHRLEGDYNDTYSTRELARIADDKGHDGVIIRNCEDVGGMSRLYGNPVSDIFIAFKGEQVKDTRNTDPTNNPDIRYSLTEEDDVIAYASENAESTDELWYTDPELEEGRVRYSMSKQDFIEGKIRKWNPAWLTEGRVLQPKSVEKSIREVVMGAMAQSDTPARYRQTLVKSLVVDAQKAFAYMKDGKESEAAALLYDSAHEMIESAKFFMDDDAFNRYKELRDYFSNFKISIEEKYYSDIDIVTYRRNNMRNILIGKNGTMIDEIWEDLCDKWPEYFSMEVEHPVEMLEALEHAFKVAKPVAVAYSSEEAMDFAGDIADDLYDIVYEGKELVSLADKYQAKAKAMKQRHKEAMQDMKQKLKEARSETQRIKRESNVKIREQRVKHKKEIAALKQKQKDKDNKKKARLIRSHMIDKLTDDYNWLVQRVLDPTKDKYVPEEFRKSLAEFLQMLDLQTENSKKLETKTGRVSQKTFKLRELKDRLENMAKTKNEDGVSMFELDSYVPYILESLTEKTEKYGGTIDSLDISDVKEIGILMKAIRHNLDNYNKRIKAEKTEEISAIGENVVKDQLKRVEKRGAAKKYGGTRDTMDIINTAALTPAYFFDRLGPAMKSMYDELRYEGFDTYVRNEQMIIRRLNDILGKYHKQRKLNKNKPKPGSTIEEWRDDRSLHTIQLKTNPEKTIEMTTAQIMSLYCLQKRKQALQHMLKGGIHITPIQSGSKIQQLKDREKGKVESAESVPLTIEDIQEIVAQLTPEQKQIADDLQQLMAVDMAKLGNQAHRGMYGYEIFDDPEYFPIKSRSNEIATDVNNVGEVVEKIKSFGPAKPLDPKASNIIEVDDIFSVVADHCNGMNLYNAYLVPISDFVRVYNAKIMQEDGRSLSVKDALEMAHGKKAMTYINNFLRDINGIKAVQRGGLEDVMNKALGTAKRTAVFGNIRVALQQPTAIVRALAVMDPKHFVPLLKVKPQKGVREEMYRYCPIAQWKSWGFYDTYMGRDIEDVMMNNWSGMDVALSGIYGELDNWTWSLIWRAVKAEQAKAHPDMDTKSEEFLQMCGRRASEVFDRTQVVDSTFHRSDAMRSKQVAVKTFTAFMAEPTLTLNVFRAGIENAREEWLDGNKGKAMGTFNRALSVIILQAAIVAAAQSFADAWRDKDPGWPGDGDDDDKEKESDYWTRWVNNYVANLFDGLHLENNIYLVKDITPYFNYMISKVAEHGDWNPWIRAAMGWDQEYLYGESNLVMSALENTATGVSQIYKKIEKGDEYEKTWYDIIQKTVSGPSTFLGFPLGTLMRDTKPIWTNILGVTFADDGSAEMPKPSKQIEGVEDGSTVDNILNHFGINLSPAEQKAKADAERNEEIEKQIGKISDKASGLTGLDKDKKIWSAVTTYYKDDGHSLSSMVESGNFSEIYRMQSMYTRAGGDSEYFVERVMAESKKALKKSIIYDPTEEQIEAQRNVREYLLGHGMSEQELSDIVYKSDTAREMKIAFRLNDKDAMMEELKPLVMAGLTYQDLERLWENRKRVNLKTYNGKYKDRLKSTGTYNWPINGQITSRFGHRSSPGGIGSTNHQGLDIAGNMGDPVGAADGGTVIYSGWYGGAGKTVMIEHDDGTVTQYSHLSWYEAKVGDVVAQGQTVGNVGSTGNSTGPHLHFGVKVNGSYVDPLEYLNS